MTFTLAKRILFSVEVLAASLWGRQVRLTRSAIHHLNLPCRDISDNQITAIPMELFQLTGLTVLYVAAVVYSCSC